MITRFRHSHPSTPRQIPSSAPHTAHRNSKIKPLSPISTFLTQKCGFTIPHTPKTPSRPSARHLPDPFPALFTPLPRIRQTRARHAFGAIPRFRRSPREAGNGVSTFTTADGTSTMSYDATSQLTGVTSGAMPSESFDYDSNGNDTSTGTINANNQLAGDWSYSYSSGYATHANWSDGDGDQVHIAYSYDGSNNVTGVTLTLASGETTPVDSTDIAPAYTYDHEGNVTSVATLNSAGTGTVFLYTYDFRNHLSSATKLTFAACTMTDSSEVDYEYNAQNQLLSRVVVGQDGNYYIYDGANIAMTVSGSCVVQSSMFTGLMQDQIFAQEDYGPTSPRWAVIDGQGSVRDTLDSAGSQLDHIVYSVFGDVRSQTDDTRSMSQLYAGYDYDPFIGDYGAYFTGPRIKIGSRFLQQDPITFSGGQLNLSVYAANDPMNGTDPGGMTDQTTQPSATQPSHITITIDLSNPSPSAARLGSLSAEDQKFLDDIMSGKTAVDSIKIIDPKPTNDPKTTNDIFDQMKDYLDKIETPYIGAAFYEASHSAKATIGDKIGAILEDQFISLLLNPGTDKSDHGTPPIRSYDLYDKQGELSDIISVRNKMDDYYAWLITNKFKDQVTCDWKRFTFSRDDARMRVGQFDTASGPFPSTAFFLGGSEGMHASGSLSIRRDPKNNEKYLVKDLDVTWEWDDTIHAKSWKEFAAAYGTWKTNLNPEHFIEGLWDVVSGGMGTDFKVHITSKAPAYQDGHQISILSLTTRPAAAVTQPATEPQK